MTIEQAKELHCGDEVFWNDPDEGRCSRIYKIACITMPPDLQKDDPIWIEDEDGSHIACYADELS